MILPPAGLAVPILPIMDLTGLSPALREPAAMSLAMAEARRPFDLARGPLLRVGLWRLDETEHLLLLALHHIVSDGWSLGVLVREVKALYTACLAAELARHADSPLPELPVQYADFAAWQRSWLAGEVLEAELGYWRERLSGAPPVLELPTDRPRPRGAELPWRGPPRVAVAATYANSLRPLPAGGSDALHDPGVGAQCAAVALDGAERFHPGHARRRPAIAWRSRA